jgi:hypothetical protein
MLRVALAGIAISVLMILVSLSRQTINIRIPTKPQSDGSRHYTLVMKAICFADYEWVFMFAAMPFALLLAMSLAS